MGQFAQALADGNLPVVWTNTFANYGLPLGLFAHQTTAYLGAFFYLFTKNLSHAYNLVVLLGSCLAGLTTYWWFRLETKLPKSALLATIVALLAPYRILNVFVRGALPEHFAGALIPLLFVGLALAVRKRSWVGLPILTVATFLLAITHPMILIITAFLAAPYFAFLQYEQSPNVWWHWRHWLQNTVFVGGSVLFGLGLASYYLLPLLLEIKYFTFGTTGSHLARGAFLTLDSFFRSDWPYFGSHPGPRAQFISAGVWESLVVIGTAVMVWLHRHHWQQYKQELFWVGKAGLLIFLLTPASLFLYQYVPVLANIQFPFRFLSIYLFIPAVLVGLLHDRTKDTFLALILVSILVVTRYPLLFTKNVILLPESSYLSTTANLHTDNLNTVWMSSSQSYPKRIEQLGIVEGKGEISELKLNTSSRSFRVLNAEPVRMVDYTFYFPGWKVTANDQLLPIEFQDPQYRGVITYQLPAGDWRVVVSFEDTKLRVLGKLLSGFTAVLLVGIYAVTWVWQTKKGGVNKHRLTPKKSL